MLTAIAVMMYILCPLPLIVLNILQIPFVGLIGVPMLFVMVAGATGLLIYNAMTKPNYYRGSDSLVGDFRDWQAGVHDRKALRRAISSALWAVIVALYMIISFWSHAWHITWIIFLIGAAVQSFLNLFLTVKK
jgi:hypothetical protein